MEVALAMTNMKTGHEASTTTLVSLGEMHLHVSVLTHILMAEPQQPNDIIILDHNDKDL